MKLANLLQRDNNNFDLFRLIAAAMVIYGHAYALAPQEGYTDFIGSKLPYDYSGSLAVKIFFFLSGLVVTDSLLKKRDIWAFVIARVFRIWPGLIALLVVTALVVGPLVTSLPSHEYFTQGQTYLYLLKNAVLFANHQLPGVFLDNPYRAAVNGSLWSLRIEVLAYISLLILFSIGAFKAIGSGIAGRCLAIGGIALLFFAADPIFGARFLLPWRTPNPMVDLLIPCFALGAVLAAFKESIEVNLPTLFLLCLAYWVLSDLPASIYIFYAAAFYAILYISWQPFFLKLKPPVDISYGVYLWGFLIQQILVCVWPGHGTQFNQMASLLIAALLGLASWHLIEKRGIALGQKLLSRRTIANPVDSKAA